MPRMDRAYFETLVHMYVDSLANIATSTGSDDDDESNSTYGGSGGLGYLCSLPPMTLPTRDHVLGLRRVRNGPPEGLAPQIRGVMVP